MRWFSSLVGLGCLGLIACGSRALEVDGANGNSLIGGPGADTGSETSSSTPAQTGETCADIDFSERLAAAMPSCSAPMPTARGWDKGNAGDLAEFKTFVVGRWLTCSLPPGIPAPAGSVGIEFTADGRSYFLTVDCTGAIVRGKGGTTSDAGPITSWENWYEFLPSGQLNLYYGGPPAGGWSGMNIPHGAFDTSPRRMWIDVMGVFSSMYVPAPERI